MSDNKPELVKCEIGPTSEVPLSDEERMAYSLMVEEGIKIREPILRRREEKKRELAEARGKKYVAKEKDRHPGYIVPDDVKRWVVMRFSGISFRKAGMLSGASWCRVQEAKAKSEEFRCALAAQEENSRNLMKAKALSLVEQSQEEDAKISVPQAQLAMKILASLDRDHFGEETSRRSSDGEGCEVKRLGGGGFVINVIGDAASVASRPVEGVGRALVYTDV